MKVYIIMKDYETVDLEGNRTQHTSIESVFDSEDKAKAYVKDWKNMSTYGHIEHERT